MVEITCKNIKLTDCLQGLCNSMGQELFETIPESRSISIHVQDKGRNRERTELRVQLRRAGAQTLHFVNDGIDVPWLLQNAKHQLLRIARNEKKKSVSRKRRVKRKNKWHLRRSV